MDRSGLRKKKLQKLARLMNQQNESGVPVTSELLDCFDVALSEIEVDYLLNLKPETDYSTKELAAFTKMSKPGFEAFFNNLLRKGVIWPSQRIETGDKYQLAPILLGWFEVFLSDGRETPVQREFAKKVNNYFESVGKLNKFPIRGALNAYFKWTGGAHRRIVSPLEEQRSGGKKIAIDRPIHPARSKVFLTDTVLGLIERYGDNNEIAVVHCFCRQMRKMLEDPCRFELPHEACIVLGRMSRHAVEHGIGQFISREEALETIEETEKRGAVHQVFHQREDLNLAEMAICNCCWDCCGILGSYNRGLMPLNLHASYVAEVTRQKCEGCAKCQRYCPVEAISMPNGYSVVDPERCVGCGQCALKCPEKAVTLLSRERDVFLPLKPKSKVRLAV